MRNDLLSEATAGAPVSHHATTLAEVTGSDQTLVLHEYWKAIFRRKWTILILGLLFGVVAGAISFSMQPLYRSTAVILIEQDKQKIVSVEEVYNGVTQGRDHINTQAELLASRDVALRVVNSLKLWNDPEFDPRLAEDALTVRLRAALGLTKTRAAWTDESLAEAVLPSFRAALNVEPVFQSQLIRVTFVSASGEMAARLANAVAEAYIASNRDARFKMTQDVATWLQDRLEGLRQKVVSSEKALQEFRDKRGLVKLGGSAEAVDQQQIMSLSQRLIDARLKRAEAESVYQQIQLVKGGDYSSVDVVARHPQVLDARNRETAAQLNVSQLSQRYGFEHPKMAQANAELEAAHQNTVRQMASVAASLARDYETARATERTLEQSLTAQRGSVAMINRAESELATLERDVQSNRQLYDMFMARAKETSVAEGMQSVVARVVDPAVAEAAPFKPVRSQIVSVAIVLGLLIGALAALLLDQLDTTLRSSEDVEERLRQPTITMLPLVGNADRKLMMHLYEERKDGLYAEAIRTARTSVMLSGIDHPHKRILITSALPGEGKSSMAANLALAYSHVKNTLLLDADMRRPQVARHFELPPGVKGLSNLVAGDAELTECLHTVENSKLTVMPCGDIPPNPTELLLSHRFKEVLNLLGERFDVVIIDTPPVQLVSDGLVIAPTVTGVVFVVKAHQTSYHLARKSLLRLQRIGADIMGVTLNSVDQKQSMSYYDGYDHYGGYTGNAKADPT